MADNLSDHLSADFRMDNTLEVDAAVFISEDFLRHCIPVQLTFRCEVVGAEDGTVTDRLPGFRVR